jgi:hypothetical protein
MMSSQLAAMVLATGARSCQGMTGSVSQVASYMRSLNLPKDI